MAESGDYKALEAPAAASTASKGFKFIWIVLLVCVTGLVVSVYYAFQTSSSSSSPDTATVYLVESLPVGDFNLELIPGNLYTGPALLDLVNQTTSTLDITVMYWSLNATDFPSNFTQEQLDAFGAGQGSALYQALFDAAARGVKLRILQGDSNNTEAEVLQKAYPNQVQLRTWYADKWYDSGIMHQKIWISDGNHIYLGSSNMDWRSLTQVKELGVMVYNSPSIANDLTDYFNAWWEWADPNFEKNHRDAAKVAVYNTRYQYEFNVPCWSQQVIGNNYDASCNNPFSSFPVTAYNLANPMQVYFNQSSSVSNKANGIKQRGSTATAGDDDVAADDDGAGPSGDQPSNVFITGAPREVFPSGGMVSWADYEAVWGTSPDYFSVETSSSGRTWDETGLVYTILDAQSTVDISVMDYYTVTSSYGLQYPVVWDALTLNLLKVATTKGLDVRILASKWAHTSRPMIVYLQSLVTNFALCKLLDPPCEGSISVKVFVVPGWNETSGTDPTYPSYSRVNHCKFIVTDRRANIGTSNMEWSYFYNTAGASLNTDDPNVVAQLQSVFERDWNSDYAYDILELPSELSITHPTPKTSTHTANNKKVT